MAPKRIRSLHRPIARPLWRAATVFGGAPQIGPGNRPYHQRWPPNHAANPGQAGAAGLRWHLLSPPRALPLDMLTARTQIPFPHGTPVPLITTTKRPQATGSSPTAVNRKVGPVELRPLAVSNSAGRRARRSAHRKPAAPLQLRVISGGPPVVARGDARAPNLAERRAKQVLGARTQALWAD